MARQDTDYCQLGGFHFFQIIGPTKNGKAVKFECACGQRRAYKRAAIKRVLTAKRRKSRYFKKGDRTE